VAPLSFADSLRERRGLVVRHPDYRRIHPRLKPWLSAGGAKKVISNTMPGIIHINEKIFFIKIPKKKRIIPKISLIALSFSQYFFPWLYHLP